MHATYTVTGYEPAFGKKFNAIVRAADLVGTSGVCIPFAHRLTLELEAGVSPGQRHIDFIRGLYEGEGCIDVTIKRESE